MSLKISKFLSYALHPLLMPSFLLLIVFNTDSYIQLTTPFKLQLILYALVFLTTFLIPVTLSVFLLKTKLIQSLQMDSAEERRVPYLITSLFYFFTYYLMRQVRVSSPIYLLFLGATLALLITMLINFRWKISAHMVGIGGVIGVLIGFSLRLYLDYRLLIVLLIFVSGILGTARLLMKAHSPAQIYVGFLVGCFSQLLLFFIV